MSPSSQSPNVDIPSTEGPDRRMSYSPYHETTTAHQEYPTPYQMPSPIYGSGGESEAPEVVSWINDQERVRSPFSTDGTVVSNYQPARLNEKGEPVTYSINETPPQKSRRRIWWIIGGVLVLLILIGVGVGLGLGLGLKKKSANTQSTSDPYCTANPQYCIGGSLDSRYYSTTGAFNGSGVAVAGESWNKESRRILTLYFQHHSGDLRWMWLDPDRGWLGGSKSETVTGNAKNATAISVVAYNVNRTASTHLFYISKDGLMKERIYQNTTDVWEDGPLNSLNLRPYDAPNVGLQACWYGNYYGGTEFSKRNAVGAEFSKRDAAPYNPPGMHLWYPVDDSSFRQYGWYFGQDEWEQSKDQTPWLRKNTHAGVGCYSWGGTNTTYAMMVNQYNGVEVWWKDTDKNTLTSDNHPINVWTNISQIAFPGAYPSTSLGYTNYFYTQMLDGSIMGRNISWAAENSTIVQDQTFTIGDTRGSMFGIKGTHSTHTAYEPKSGGAVLNSFYQTRGDDITLFQRDGVRGDWFSKQLPIPDD